MTCGDRLSHKIEISLTLFFSLCLPLPLLLFLSLSFFVCVNDNDKLNIPKITTKLLEINHMNKFTKNSNEKEDSFKGELHSSFFSTLI